MKRTPIIATLAVLLLARPWLAGPSASADDGCTGVMNQSGCRPAPWDGQLMPTWNIPGYYGGWTSGPVSCDPLTLQCRGWAQP